MTSTPKTRPEFWQQKFEANLARDARTTAALQALGWRVVVVWECELRDVVRLEKRLAKVFETGSTSGTPARKLKR
jgi:DNA mismatch endonuclease (patch repair protein)